LTFSGKQDSLFIPLAPLDSQVHDLTGGNRDTFLKSIYAIFDVGNKQFGAVQRVDDTGASLEPLPASGQ